jgi:hypothetical protein
LLLTLLYFFSEELFDEISDNVAELVIVQRFVRHEFFLFIFELCLMSRDPLSFAVQIFLKLLDRQELLLLQTFL